MTLTTTPTMDEHDRAAMEKAVATRDSLEATVQEAARPGVMQRFRKSIAPYALALGGLLTSLGVGTAQEAPKDASIHK